MIIEEALLVFESGFGVQRCVNTNSSFHSSIVATQSVQRQGSRITTMNEKNFYSRMPLPEGLIKKSETDWGTKIILIAPKEKPDFDERKLKTTKR